jgi:hypothetical protein
LVLYRMESKGAPPALAPGEDTPQVGKLGPGFECGPSLSWIRAMASGEPAVHHLSAFNGCAGRVVAVEPPASHHGHRGLAAGGLCCALLSPPLYPARVSIPSTTPPCYDKPTQRAPSSPPYPPLPHPGMHDGRVRPAGYPRPPRALPSAVTAGRPTCMAADPRRGHGGRP